jgi:hypothetical protein
MTDSKKDAGVFPNQWPISSHRRGGGGELRSHRCNFRDSEHAYPRLLCSSAALLLHQKTLRLHRSLRRHSNGSHGTKNNKNEKDVDFEKIQFLPSSRSIDTQYRAKLKNNTQVEHKRTKYNATREENGENQGSRNFFGGSRCANNKHKMKEHKKLRI